jgi:membrane-bound lytic murein transglycosylase D
MLVVRRLNRLGWLALVLMLGACGERRQLLVQFPALGPFPAPEPLKTSPASNLLGTGSTAPFPLEEPSQAAPQTQAPQNPDPVNDLLDRVDKVYKAGVNDYSAGKLDQAKTEFDQAVSLLLESKFDIQSDDRLSSEFNRLVENIYSMELGAVENGNTLSSHRYEPAPIQAFAGLTFPVDPNVRERAQQEVAVIQSDLPLVSNDLVSGALTYLQNHARHYVQTVLDRRAYYGPMIEETLRQEGLPQDLIYLAAGESAFNPFAVSTKGAKGIWQFMPETGELYGLHRNRWVDEREDPVKSTRAAARHLKDLYHTFGDWFLAMAAYDWNPAGVQKAIQKTGYADYWKLRELHALPSETENYVPIFVAVALIAKDPQAYGFQATTAAQTQLDQVQVSEPTDLRLVAGLIDHPVDELVRLNPGMLGWVTPPGESSFTLTLPAGTKDQFEEAITAVPASKREWWRAYRLEASDSLAGVASRFHTSLAALRAANQLLNDDPPQPGTHLLVPLGPTSESSLLRVHERSVLKARLYRVKPGDTLELVADRFDVTPYQIRHWNHMSGSALTAGRSLTVFVPTPVRSSPGSHTRHSKSKRKRSTAAAGK